MISNELNEVGRHATLSNPTHDSKNAYNLNLLKTFLGLIVLAGEGGDVSSLLGSLSQA